MLLGMGEPVTTTLDEDLYDKVLEEHRNSGKSKSQVVNDRVRAGFNGDAHTLSDTILPIFGQGLFVAGFVVAFYALLVVGVSMALIGLGVIIGAKGDEYAKRHDVDKATAYKRVLGV